LYVAEPVEMEVTPIPMEFQEEDATDGFQDTVVEEAVVEQIEADFQIADFETPDGGADADHTVDGGDVRVGEDQPDGGEGVAKEDHEATNAVNQHSIYLAGGMLKPSIVQGIESLLCIEGTLALVFVHDVVHATNVRILKSIIN
jgi:hypothetical protein